MRIDKENSGIIFENRDKQSDKAPDWSGMINVNGEQLRIALWENRGKEGDIYYGVKISEDESGAGQDNRDSRGGYSRGGGNQRSSGGYSRGGSRGGGGGYNRSYNRDEEEQQESRGGNYGGSSNRTYSKPTRR